MAEISPRTTWKLAKALRGKRSKPTRNVGVAVVTRVDRDGTRWIRMPGASMDTPVNGSVVANASVGESVSYRVEDGRLSITGNASDPAMGVAAVNATVGPVAEAVESVRGDVIEARSENETTMKVASEARNVANATSQNFWHDDNGVHVTEVTQDEWKDSEGTSHHSGPNMLINSVGQLLRNGLNNLVSITSSAIAFYDGLGNAASNILAQFGKDGVQIGRSSGLHSLVSAKGFAIDYGSDNVFEVSTDGVTTEIYAGGSTLPTGVTRTNAAMKALRDYFNSGCTPFVDGDVAYVLDPHGDYTGYTLNRTDLSSAPSVLDGDGRMLCSADYSDLYWWSEEAKWGLSYNLVPMTEVDTMPCNMSAGGVKATMSDRHMVLEADNMTVDWDGIISAGRSESTVTISSDIRAAAANQIWSNGVVCTVTLNVSIDAALADGAAVTVGTIPEGYRPPHGVYVPCAAGSSHGQSDCFMSTNANGTITLRNRHGAQIAAGRYFAATFTYAL